ncbi:MAG TPA: hypothetical protein VFQ45_13600 [Longimicrobium sp.]|nr:hypothetical protein [Longimicrobium sp.]
MQHSSLLRRTLAVCLAAALAACGGDEPGQQAANVEDIDQKSSATATEKEIAAFRAPADSVLTPAQVDAYLKTTLLQFDYLRSEARGLHDRAAKIEDRGKDENVVSGLRNLGASMSLITDMADLVGGSYVRAARSQGYNPAEMEWVRERMTELAGHLAMQPMYEASLRSAETMRQQAAAYRQQMAAGTLPGFTEENIKEMERTAEEAEKQAREQLGSAGAMARNLAVLRRAKPAVTDEMWTGVAFVGGASGLFGLSGLADPADTTAQRQLTEWRQLYLDALANKVTPGMEADPKPAAEHPAAPATPN